MKSYVSEPSHPAVLRHYPDTAMEIATNCIAKHGFALLSDRHVGTLHTLATLDMEIKLVSLPSLPWFWSTWCDSATTFALQLNWTKAWTEKADGNFDATRVVVPAADCNRIAGIEDTANVWSRPLQEQRY